MKFIETLHEECEDCTHTVEVYIPEGPKTLAEFKRDELWMRIYFPLLEEMLESSKILGHINTKEA